MYNLTRIANAHNAADFVKARYKLKQIMAKPVRREDGTIMLRSQL